MVLEETLTGLERGRAQLDFRVVFHPDLKPTSHGVGFRFAVVDADVLLDGFFQFFFYFRLRFSEDIFDDGLSGFRIVTDSVSSLPAAVLSFADVLLLLQRCDFWTVKKPFPLTTAEQNMSRFFWNSSGSRKTAPVPCERDRSCFFRHFMERYKNAAICALVQAASGSKRPPPTPEVMPCSTAQATACA